MTRGGGSGIVAAAPSSALARLVLIGHLDAPNGRIVQRRRPTNPFVEFREEEVEQSTPARFEQQVRRHPGRLAVKTGAGELSYAALNRQANRIARAILARRGAGEESVALLLEHGAPMVAAILGVLKAGKICVPLDRWYPLPRNRYILDHARAGLVVTDRENVRESEALADDQLQVMNVDEIDAQLSGENLERSISPDTIAYILYTSGSTGRPKGVVHSHRNLLHAVMGSTNALHICERDRVTLSSSFSHGRALLDMFVALLNGAALLTYDLKREGLIGLAGWLMREAITVFHTTPTIFRGLAATLTDEAFPKLRLIRMGAEPLRKDDVALYKAHFPSSCILANRYSGTEFVAACLFFVDPETEIAGGLVPVGYPLAGTEVLLVDDGGNPVGPGRVGEIAIRSRHLALRYWRDPGLTDAAFTPDSAGGGKRIYRTGDIGRMLPDGCLLHLGRKDSQVKIRGYRIEVAEIELALLELEGTREAVVVAQEDGSGDRRLVAYVVPSGQPAITPGTLRRALVASLPDYMLPATFVLLDALPRTPNGKVERTALPNPARTRSESDEPFAAPRSPVEEVLAGIWAAVLELEQVGVHDDFLALGGDSLLASQVVARLCDTFRMEAPLHAVLAAPTVADQAAVIVREEPTPGQVATIARLRRQIAGMSTDERRARLREAKEARAQRRTESDDVGGEVTPSGEQDERAVRR